MPNAPFFRAVDINLSAILYQMKKKILVTLMGLISGQSYGQLSKKTE